MTFARPATNRHIDFNEIASKTSIPLNEVEILTMKAMSLGLVRGTIDQVRIFVKYKFVERYCIFEVMFEVLFFSEHKRDSRSLLNIKISITCSFLTSIYRLFSIMQ